MHLHFVQQLARKCEPYDVKWIEETLPPDDYEGYSELKKAVKTTLITTGEHEVWSSVSFVINGFRQLILIVCIAFQPTVYQIWIQDVTRKEMC